MAANSQAGSSHTMKDAVKDTTLGFMERVIERMETLENSWNQDVDSLTKERETISKVKEELKELHNQYRIGTVMEVKRVLTKRNLMIQLENKCKELKLQIKRFNRKFNVLQEKGLPTLRTSNGKLFPL